MEFLSTLSTIGALISEGVKLGKLAFRKKSEKFQVLKNEFSTLKKEVNHEGEKIGKYSDFTKLIADIDRALKAIRKSNDDISDDIQFWEHVRPFQEDLYEFGVAQLRAFNIDMFEQVDQQRINERAPRLSDHIVVARDQYDQRNRDVYMEHLRDAVAEIGYLRAVGVRIVEDIGAKLRQF